MFCVQNMYSILGVGCDFPVFSSPMGEAAADRQMRKQKIISDDKATLSNTARVSGRKGRCPELVWS